MNFYFTIKDLKPIGLNHSYFLSCRGKHATRIKKDITRDFESIAEKQLTCIQENKSQIEEFNKIYNESKHYLEFNMRFHLPVLTQKNLINKRGGDYDGLIKIPQDCLFKHLNADDSAIISASQIKIHSGDFKIEMHLKIKDLILYI